jgi:hypothetical protein
MEHFIVEIRATDGRSGDVERVIDGPESGGTEILWRLWHEMEWSSTRTYGILPEVA